MPDARMLRRAAMLGLAIGMAYTLSPLTVWFAIAMGMVLVWSAAGVDAQERRWIWWMLVVAVALKTVALCLMLARNGLFATTVPSFFGDEAYFKKRALLLRSIALAIPISPEDIVDAYDAYSATSYLYVLAFLQVLSGPSPLGVHLFNWIVSLASTVLLYRAVRPSFGAAASLLGLGITLFLPSVFMWSTSALKEPLFLALTTASMMAALVVLRERSLFRRALAIVCCLAAAWAAETVRANAVAGIAAGMVGALVGRFVIPRPRVAVAGALVSIVILSAALTRPAVRDQILSRIRIGAATHRGHVNTAGYTYRLLDDKYYADPSLVLAMPWAEALPYAARAVVSYVFVPLPWQIRSPDAVLFIPEQMIWLALIALAPVGVLAGLRRDPALTGMLVAYSLVAGLAVALASGNIGTLIRHRGTMTVYLVWLSALGACELLRDMLQRQQGVAAVAGAPGSEGHVHALD